MRTPLRLLILPEDRERAERIAHVRNDHKLPHQNKRMSGRSDFAIHLEGAVAEVVFARFWGGIVDETKRVHGDKGGPDILIDGVGVSMKAVNQHYIPPILKVTTRKELNVDVFVLGVVEQRHVKYFGWADPELFDKEVGFRRDFGHGPRFCLHAQDLYSLDVFL